MLRRTSSYMIAYGVPAVLGFCAIVLFTRLLSPDEYGVYVVGMSVAGIVNAVLFAWVRLSVLRYQSEGEDTDIRMSALAGYMLSACLSPLVLLAMMFIAGLSAVQLVLAGFVALALGLFEFGQEILKARQQAGTYTRAAILRSVLTLGFSLTLVMLGLSGEGLLLGIAGAYLAASLFFARSIWRGPVRGFDRVIFTTMLTFGAPMALSGAAFALHAALDRLIVVYLLGEASAGVYGASADLVRQIILFPAMAVGAATVPVIIRSLGEGGAQRADAELRSAFELLLAVVVPAVIGLAIVAPAFSALMLGPEFRDMAALLIPILAFAWLFQAVTHQFVQVSFHLARKPRLLLMQGIVLLSVNVAATLVLTPRFGLAGAAWALVIAEAIGVFAGYLLARRAHPLPLQTGPLLRVAGAGLAMAVPTLMAMRLADDPLAQLAVAVPVGIASYAIAALAFNISGIRTLALQRLLPA